MTQNIPTKFLDISDVYKAISLLDNGVDYSIADGLNIYQELKTIQQKARELNDPMLVGISVNRKFYDQVHQIISRNENITPKTN